MTALTPDEVVGERFQVLEFAAAGGMGEVYRARDQRAGELVALKVLRPGAVRFVERFDREARVLAQLRHPGIVRYVAHGHLPSGGLYLAMEWLDGIDLGARLQGGPLSIEESAQLAAQTAAALAAAHARLVIHRDIKPSNLFLSGGDVRAAKILDFGVARLEMDRGRLTDTGDVMGTPRYMAPEQWRASAQIDARADVFSLGVVLYECLTGAQPYRGDSPAAILGEMLSAGRPPPPSIHRADIPAVLDDLIQRMIGTDPATRPADGAALLAELVALGDIEASAAAPSELTAAEQRVESVVVLAAPPDDGSTVDAAAQMTQSEAPPAARARKVIEALAQAHGGRVVRRGDGAVLVVVADQHVAGDQATRAARCALALARLLPDQPLAIVTGRGLSRPAAQADLLERAGRHTRQTGTERRLDIGIDEVTAGLLPGRFCLSGDAGGLALTGELDVEEAARLLLGRPAPFVGRDRELRVLLDTFDECRRDQIARAVLVSAPAGMGKSRLRFELVEQLHRRGDPLQVWIGRGDPARIGSPFAIVGDAIRRVCGLQVGDPRAVQQDKLRARVARTMPETEVRETTAFLGELVGASFADATCEALQVARRDPSAMSDGIRRAWEAWLAAECRDRPVLLLLEDLHWGDASSIKLVEAAVRREQPFMVLALARPEVREAFPGMFAGAGRQELHLGKLSRAASVALAEKVLGDQVSADAVERAVALASGHPLYLEELIRHLAEGRDARELPETVLAMVQARLEGMEADARRVLRAASLFGEVFWTDGVAALLGETFTAARLRDWLDEMAEREVLERRPTSRLRRQEEWIFRHALVRDAAYAMLTEEDRALGHRLAGDWMEGAGEQNHALLAEHFERGNDPARAATRLEQACRDALRAEAMEEADRYFEHAMRLYATLPADPDTARRRVQLVLDHLPAVLTLLKFPGYERILLEHEPLAAGLGDDALLGTLYARLGESLWATSRFDEAIAYLERGIALCEAAGAHESAAYAYQSWAFSHVWLGNYRTALESVAPLEVHLGADPHPRWHVYGLGAAATAHLGLAEWDEAIRQAHRGLEIARASKEPGVISFAAWMLSFSHALGGDAGAAIEFAQTSHSAALTPGDQIWSECALAVALCPSEPARTAEILGPLMPVMREAKFSGGELFASALVDAYAALGDVGRAQAEAAEILRLAETHRMRPHALVAHRQLAELALQATSGAEAVAEAEAHMAEARRLIGELDSPHERALVQVAAARLLEREDRTDEARLELRQALDTFDRLRSPRLPLDLPELRERLAP